MTRSDQTDPNPPGTVLESDDEIKKVQQSLRGSSTAKRPSSERPFRPSVRPPMAVMTIYDDGRNDGEDIRIRADQFVIGRTEGDLKLPFDELLSSRHVAVTRQVVQGKWRWVITDLQSRNGVFFRVSKAPLNQDGEFLIGRGCYKFQIIQQTGPETAAWDNAGGLAPGTRAFQADLQAGTATITEVVRGGIGSRITLAKDHYTIGSAGDCDIVRGDDPYSAPLHADLRRSERGTWMISNHGSRNGVWLRLPQIVLDRGKNCDFQAGEQRFRLSYGAKA
jgi:pSer/pThr/pTyr-binding forkhead associated (FHA) protein